MWKRKAEEYLVRSGTMNYTIIHPGGLIDDEVCLFWALGFRAAYDLARLRMHGKLCTHLAGGHANVRYLLGTVRT